MPSPPQHPQPAAPRHHLQWKGVTIGPYTELEIKELLAKGEIGLMHRIDNNGRWQSLSEYLFPAPAAKTPPPPNLLSPPSPPPNTPAPEAPANTEQLDRLILTGYILCGATVVLPILATLPAFWIATHLHAQGAHEPARLQYILGTAFTLIGLLLIAILLAN
ncbi:MAG: hypothetical protein LBD14_05750 [Puniceicoccales bacterium]|jgi:hypothetical protein|nr:hypothetical protein [Puniceicoccales bacterium]